MYRNTDPLSSDHDYNRFVTLFNPLHAMLSFFIIHSLEVMYRYLKITHVGLI